MQKLVWYKAELLVAGEIGWDQKPVEILPRLPDLRERGLFRNQCLISVDFGFQLGRCNLLFEYIETRLRYGPDRELVRQYSILNELQLFGDARLNFRQ